MATTVPTLDLAVSLTDRTVPILLERVTMRERKIAWQDVQLEEIFVRQMSDTPFHVAECSLASYLIARARGEDRLTAIPVFLSRAFRHNAIYVRADSTATTLADLRGARFGVPEFQMTAAVWVRALLRDAGMGNGDFTWTTYRPERVAIEVPAKPGTSRDAVAALIEGEVDVIFTARRPSADVFPTTGEPGAIRRLLADPWREEREYYARTRIFPIMHLVALDTTVVCDQALIRSAYDLFAAARAYAFGLLHETVYSAVALPWLEERVELTERTMNDDWWTYGVARNWAQLEIFMDALIADGLLPRRLTLDEVFSSSTHDT